MKSDIVKLVKLMVKDSKFYMKAAKSKRYKKYFKKLSKAETKEVGRYYGRESVMRSDIAEKGPRVIRKVTDKDRHRLFLRAIKDTLNQRKKRVLFRKKK